MDKTHSSAATGPFIPVGACADRYARRVGVAAVREIKNIPIGIPALKGSKLMPAGISSHGRTAEVDIPITDAIQQLRDQLREVILEGKDKDIVFTPNGIEVELSVNFKAEATGKGGFKLLAFLDLSAEAKASRESQHKIKLSLSVSDKDGKPLKIRSDRSRSDLPG